MVEAYAIDALDRSHVLRYLGYRGQELDPVLEDRLDAVIADALGLVRAKASWECFAIAERSADADGTPRISLEGSALELTGASIARHLDGASHAVVLAVTAGLGIDRELARLAATDATAQAIMDAAGTEAVEQAAKAASASIAAWAAGQGLRTGARFSPGYGDLPLACQPELLASIDAGRRLGIHLSDSLLMTPVKSVTAIIGVFGRQDEADAASLASGAAEGE